MQATLNQELEEFRAELRSWMESNTPAGLVELFDWNNAMTRRGQEGVRAAHASPLFKEWESRLLEAHLICAHWPVEVGGRGLSAAKLSIVGEEFYRAGVPVINRGMGELLVGPSIIVHGTDEQKGVLSSRGSSTAPTSTARDSPSRITDPTWRRLRRRVSSTATKSS